PGVTTDWVPKTIEELEADGLLELRPGFAEGGHNVEGRGVPHLRPFNVTSDGRIDLERIKFVAPPPDDSPHWLRPGDVIFNNTNSEDLTGKTALFESEIRCVPSNHMTVLRATSAESPDPYWLGAQLRYLWKTGFFKTLLRRYVGQASASLTRLRTVEIPVPPISEQRAIAHVLRTVQRAKAATHQLIAATRDLKKSLMRHLLAYGFVGTRESSTALALEPEHVDGLPNHWRMKRVREMGTVVTGRTPPTDAEANFGGPYSFFTPGDIGAEAPLCTADRTLSELGLRAARPLSAGTTLVVCIGASIGKVGITKAEIAATNQQINAVVPNETMDPEFLYYSMLNAAGRIAASARRTTMPILSKGSFEELRFPIPPLPEQVKIGASIRALDMKILAELSRRDALSRLFDSLLHDLMTARLRVNDLEILE
ncbi:MAG: restriction endonuclease subunit S, partial [Vicinamibacteraceae bacterium]